MESMIRRKWRKSRYETILRWMRKMDGALDKIERLPRDSSEKAKLKTLDR